MTDAARAANVGHPKGLFYIAFTEAWDPSSTLSSALVRLTSARIDGGQPFESYHLALGAPEPVTMGAQATAALPSFSRDGRRLAFQSRVRSINPFDIPFDPPTLEAGPPRLLDSRTNVRIPSDVSPDGSLVAFFNLGERQEDIFRRVFGVPISDRGTALSPPTLLNHSELLGCFNKTGRRPGWR